MHSAAVSAEGDAFLWGYGKFNQLGLGEAEDAEMPAALPPLRGATAGLACGFQHTLAVTRTGDVLAWGANQVRGCCPAGRKGREEVEWWGGEAAADVPLHLHHDSWLEAQPACHTTAGTALLS